MVVTVRAAILPEPSGKTPHPTFWVTIQNNRDSRIVVNPAQARLIDSFGNQSAPLPFTMETGSERTVYYTRVDPEVHGFIFLHYGWPYYPLYPYPHWFRGRHFARGRFWGYDPFWDLDYQTVWIREVRPVRSRSAETRVDKEEPIYQGAKLTYVLVFPELHDLVKELRLIVPDVTVREKDGTTRTLEFELVFDQVVTIGKEGEKSK